jgi:dynein heavy chain
MIHTKIQVHQRDVFSDLTKRFREKKLSDANDFEWLKQVRPMPYDIDDI